MGFQFANYDVKELEECGQEFERAFASCALSGNREWSPNVFKWFRETAADEVSVYPEWETGKKGEFIVDHCHTTYPIRGDEDGWPSLNWYERAFARQCTMKMAIECEWGKWANGELSLVMVLDDAAKLAVLRAQTKIMIFASHWKDERNRVPEALAKLRKCHKDSDPWLWIDVPNEPKRAAGARRNIRHGLLVD
jgi:hypothetical protein